MTPEEKTALAVRLRRFATEYEKIARRAANIRQMVDDLRAAADELDPPAE